MAVSYTHLFANGETVGGGYGGMWDQDGTSGVNTHMTNTRNTPVEVLETIMPVKVIRYGLMPVSYTHLDVYKRQADDRGQPLRNSESRRAEGKVA